MTIFSAKNLTLGYDGQAVAENLNFSVETGDYLCIIGENGSGKSTLIKTLLGLAKPLSGEIERSEAFSPRRIGYMPQQTPLQQDFPASVREVVLSGCLGGKGFWSFYTKADRKMAAQIMERLGISDLADRCIRELSGGQKQRVFLARALCAAKDVLLVDEPCAGLDASGAEELYALLDELHRTDGMTILMVTHDLEAARHYADKVLHLGGSRFFLARDEYWAFLQKEQNKQNKQDETEGKNNG